MKRNRSNILLLLKLSFAAAIIGWMVRSHRLDPTRLSQAVQHWAHLLAIGAICYFALFVSTARWRMLLASQKAALSVWRSFSLTMIGAMFSTLIPGAVSGDLVKAYYVGARVPLRFGISRDESVYS